MTTKLIGAAERSSVQDRLRSLPQLRQASATLSGRGAGPGPARPLHPESVKPWRRPRWPGRGRDRPHPVQRAQPAGRVRHHAHLRGASDRAIAHQTRHRSLATLDGYVRVHTASADNAATQLGL